jgi:hypothetical protein
MRISPGRHFRWGCAAVALLAASCQQEARRPEPRRAVVQVANTPARISMADLHMSGGVPPNWVFALPVGDADAGRKLFQDYGCNSCHAVSGESFSPRTPLPGEVGPDLSGMGTHHPQVYFVESILNPDAVLVEGPGYISADGRSAMPAYPDLTAEQLNHLVAYLKSLVDPGGVDHSAHSNTFTGRVDLDAGNVPAPDAAPRATAAPGAPKASVFFVQTYSVRDGRLAELERWFSTSGLATFRSFDGLLEIESWVDRTRGPEAMVTLFGFADIDRLRAFLAERSIAESLQKFDEFSDMIDRQIYETRPVYRVGALSAG